VSMQCLYPSEDWMSTGRYWGFKENQLFYGIDVVDNEFWQRPILSEQHSNYFLFVGRLIQVKNLLFLLKAYTRYRQEVQNPYDLFIVGDGVERDRICQYIKQTNLEGVKLVPFLQQIDLISIYRNARAFILPSIQETWGLVINEAMASGLPIISSTKCGATSILVKEGHNGYTFSPDCEEELIDKMILFDKSSYEEQSLMGEHSLEMISHWGLSKFSEGCYKAIKYVLTAPYRRLSFIDVIILNKWKGRYRPV
jgi:glycosyltransferase involved in cell wall biosynthesis